ncbi:MAG: (2Fe-2S) ferredoxin domain-containing protein [Proteobacteria bacterium]|nr:(2Fe-2S) ferredoxin domain-containing protein [Pseudomonadota bacterium]MCP4920868.1 (2Fe-2S) ferredoxin domain-containing protein [Pseudomonadota bacterium]
MKPMNSPFQEIVLVCDNTRPPGAPKHSCGDHGARAMRKSLKKALKAEGLWGEKVRVLMTSCLDVCPKEGVICSFDRGETLELVDADTETDLVLARIREMCRD